jgi:ribosomal protein L11 methyltransferase
MSQPAAGAPFVEVSVTVGRDVVEALCDFIIENFSSGMVLEDEEGSSETTVKFYLSESASDDYHERLSKYLTQRLGADCTKVPEIRSRTLSSVDWEQQYRNSVEPIVIEPGIVIRPPWQEPIESALYDIIIEPKIAFGTGQHETTRSCLKVIAERFRPGSRFLDLGCGSGILSILADKKKASVIKAIDYDGLAIDNCRENFLLNDVAAPFEILLGSIEQCEKDASYEFVCANIIKETILEMLPALKHLVSSRGILLLAGLLARDEDEVRARLVEVGLTEFSTVPDNEWLTFVVDRE